MDTPADDDAPPTSDPPAPRDELDEARVAAIITDLEAEFHRESGVIGPNDAVAALPPLPEVLPPGPAHLGQHDLPLPHEQSTIERFDELVDRAFDRLRGTEPADRLFYAITELADFSLLWMLIAAARAAIDEDELPNAIRVATVLGIESVAVNAVIKSAFKRERPVRQTERPYKLRVPLTTSFPSGHSSAAVVAAMLLSEHGNPKAKPFWFALAGFVATSRIYVQIHHASDVVGGFAVGAVLGTVAKRAWPVERGPIGVRRLRRRPAR